MRAATLRTYAALPALAVCCCCMLLSGCSVWNSLFHRSHDNRCTEKPFQGNTETLAGLRVPEGLSPPEQRNQVKIPKLNEPERVRSKNEPCLSQPPSYASGSSIALPTRSRAPIGAPAAAPVPVSPTEPSAPSPDTVPESSLPPLTPVPATPKEPATPQPPATPAPPEPPIPNAPQ
ncbi:MAG TPA: hypothetical protein VGL50_06235 [Steroidobacteraceae bacterium]